MTEPELISRRDFLRGALAALGTGLLAACAPAGLRGAPFPEPYSTATPARVLASPPPPEGAPRETPAPGVEPGSELQRFLALSALLTGVDNLDPVLGRVYLQSLEASDEFDVTIAGLLEQTGFDGDAPPSSIEELEARGLFASSDAEADGGASALADRIIESWYTGIYTDAEGEDAVATFVDALAWKALDFTKPNSVCGSPGFWGERPGEMLPRGAS